MEIIEGFLVVVSVAGISWGVAYLELRRQLGRDYRNFIEFVRYRAEEASKGDE